MLDFLVHLFWEVLLYFIGYGFLKGVTLGRFKDPKGSDWVSAIGAAVSLSSVVAFILIWLN
ncbi:hypothetical protein [Pseudomonas entomophila]|uniref:Uncharacterized protein n=1 Tax=Pseudomonas entomophila TaxID=312306 RepID=A0ABY9QKK3_9PSED|nr:hypothetical protein [Pseudomonas entomophila]WMW03690.1 hypothetical protein RAH46_15205 [Pseudomonas entomophila]